MKDTKYRTETLALYEYRRVEEHLSAMAARGWRLESIGARLWKYRRAEPAKVHYAVAYIQDASQFNPGPTERQQTLEELCAAAGWQKVTDWFQMQIYCSEAENPVPLETEESLRLDAVHRSMRRNFLPANIIFLLVSLVILGLFVRALILRPLRILESNAYLFIGPLLILLALDLAVPLMNYWRWYRRSRESTAQSGPCASPGDIRWLSRLSYGLLISWTALYLLSQLTSGQTGPIVYFVFYQLMFLLLVFLLRKTTALLRRKKASFGLNLFLTLLADVVLATVLIGGLSFIVIKGGWFSGSRNETYTYAQEPWDVSPIDIPLTVSDLTGEEYGHIRRSKYDLGSILISRRSCHDTVREGNERLWLNYEITTPREWLYDTVAENAPAPREESLSFRSARFSWLYTWEEVPAAPWGAEAAYRQLVDGEVRDTWLLIFSDRLAELTPSWDLTPEQMALAGDILRHT